MGDYWSFEAMSPEERQAFFQRVYDAVRRIPPGRVVTYGQIAIWVAGTPAAARTVGWALGALPSGTDVPWHRVVNASGGISTSGREAGARKQRLLLESEGVEFDPKGRIDLSKFRWEG